MFSRLEPYFKTTFREAERTDTRQAIREEERENRRKNKDEDEKGQKSQDLWTDSTSVSVGALRIFLMNFLQSQIEKEQKSTKAVPMQSEEQNHAPTTLGGRAAKAYQNTAGHTPSRQSPAESHIPQNSDVANEDVRIMNKLIDDLSFLEKHNINDLNIPRAGTFLESLKTAIQRAVQNIHN